MVPLLLSSLLAGIAPLTVLAVEPESGEPLPASLGDLTAPPPLPLPQSTDDFGEPTLRPLSMEEAQQLAQANHPSLHALALEVKSREAQLEASFLNLLKPQVTLQSSSGLPSFSLQHQYDQTSSSTSGEVGTNINVDVVWLWKNPQLEPGLAADRHGLEQLRLQHKLLERDVRLQVAEAYHEVQRTDGEVKLRVAAVDSAQATLTISRARHRAGVAARLDVLQAQNQLIDSEALLASAKAGQITARRHLARVLNLPQGVVPTAHDPNTRQGTWGATLEESVIAAFASREELQQFLAAIQERDERAKEALAALQPTISLFATGSWGQDSGNLINRASGPELRGQISTALGLRFTVPLSDGGSSQASARRWTLAARQQEHLLANARNSFQENVEREFSALHAQEKVLELRERQVEVQKEILELTRARYEAGVATQQDMIDQQNTLTRAAVNHTWAIVDYNLNLARLHRYTGLPIQP